MATLRTSGDSQRVSGKEANARSLTFQSLKELSISLGSHGSVSSEEGSARPSGQPGQPPPDPPASAQPLPVKISRVAPLSSTSEVTLNSLNE